MDAVRATGTSLPIVFVVVSNPVGAGYVSNLSRPGGNITGFSTFEPEMAGKWLQLLRQLSPGMKHVNMLLDPELQGLQFAVAGSGGNRAATRHRCRTQHARAACRRLKPRSQRLQNRIRRVSLSVRVP